jgi:hypothetical protein
MNVKIVVGALIFSFGGIILFSINNKVSSKIKMGVTLVGQGNNHPTPLSSQQKDSIQVEYEHHKRRILEKRNDYCQKWIAAGPEGKKKIEQEAPQYFRKNLLENVIPCWYGTPWDFNGISDTPQDGLIACGYFVSTTLQHNGLKLNRYKLAQQHGFNVVKTLCDSSQTFTTISALLKHVVALPEALYVIGLDNHVGFLSKEGENIYFIHSNYIIPSAVVKEKAQLSAALFNSSIYMIGSLSSNNKLIRKWIKGESIQIIQ